MKGQFLLISSVVIGLIIISASSSIADIQSKEFHHEPAYYEINSLKYEAGKVDLSSQKERESFAEMAAELPGYTTETEAWDKESDGDFDCFNITLESPDSRLRMKCIS